MRRLRLQGSPGLRTTTLALSLVRELLALCVPISFFRAFAPDAIPSTCRFVLLLTNALSVKTSCLAVMA